MTDGDKHKRIRTRLGLTQDEFAEILGVAMSTVSRWEHNHVAPPLHAARILRTIAAVADIPGADIAITRARKRGPVYTLHTLLQLAYKEKS